MTDTFGLALPVWNKSIGSSAIHRNQNFCFQVCPTAWLQPYSMIISNIAIEPCDYIRTLDDVKDFLLILDEIFKNQMSQRKKGRSESCTNPKGWKRN